MLSVDIFFTQKIRMKRGANSASPNGNRGDDDGGYFDEGGEECDRVNYGYDNQGNGVGNGNNYFEYMGLFKGLRVLRQ